MATQKHPVSFLQEWMAKQDKPLPQYNIVTSPAGFVCTVTLDGITASRTAASKQAAKFEAATVAVKILKEKLPKQLSKINEKSALTYSFDSSGDLILLDDESPNTTSNKPFTLDSMASSINPFVSKHTPSASNQFISEQTSFFTKQHQSAENNQPLCSGKHPISELQEIFAQQRKPPPDYIITDVSVKNFPSFRCSLTIDGKVFMSEAPSKQVARKDAAEKALKHLKQHLPQTLPDGATVVRVTKAVGYNAIGVLNEYLQKKGNLTAAYQEQGLSQNNEFVILCSAAGKSTQGYGMNKKEAKQDAAHKMIKVLNISGQAAVPIPAPVNIMDNEEDVPEMKQELLECLADLKVPYKCRTMQKDVSLQDVPEMKQESLECLADLKSLNQHLPQTLPNGPTIVQANNAVGYNAIGVLNEYLQRKGNLTAAYQEQGMSQNKEFIILCSAAGKSTQGYGMNKKEAKQDAAHKMIKVLNISGQAAVPIPAPVNIMDNEEDVPEMKQELLECLADLKVPYKCRTMQKDVSLQDVPEMKQESLECLADLKSLNQHLPQTLPNGPTIVQANNAVGYNAIGVLNEYLQRKGNLTAAYQEQGMSQNKEFIILCSAAGKSTQGYGMNKKEAKQDAAHKMIKVLNISGQAAVPIPAPVNIMDNEEDVPETKQELLECLADLKVPYKCSTMQKDVSLQDVPEMKQESLECLADLKSLNQHLPQTLPNGPTIVQANNAVGYNAIGVLNEYLQRKGNLTAAYQEQGMSQNKEFIILCSVAGKSTQGYGMNKKEAKQDAAHKMIKALNISGQAAVPIPAPVNIMDNEEDVPETKQELLECLADLKVPYKCSTMQKDVSLQDVPEMKQESLECLADLKSLNQHLPQTLPNGPTIVQANNAVGYNAIGVLNEYLQRKGNLTAAYQEQGMSQNKEFIILCSVAGKSTQGYGMNKKEAKQDAAHKMIKALNISGQAAVSTSNALVKIMDDEEVIKKYTALNNNVIQSPTKKQEELTLAGSTTKDVPETKQELLECLGNLNVPYKCSAMQKDPLILCLAFQDEVQTTALGIGESYEEAYVDVLKRAYKLKITSDV